MGGERPADDTCGAAPAPALARPEPAATSGPEGVDVEALEAQARECLPEEVYDYYACGAGRELTLAENLSAWRRIRLRPRVLRDVSTADTSLTLAGRELRLPVAVAPMAFQRLLHEDGEAAMAEGAAAAGALMVVSTRSSTPLREIAAAAPGAPRWLQLYVLRDRAWTEAVLAEAVAGGCSAIVLTANTPYIGPKLRHSLLDFAPPEHLYMVDGRRPGRGNPGALQDPTLTPAVIGWIRERCPLPVLVKGVLRGDDALACVAAGAAGVVVSNHGGRQLDGAVASAEALPEVAEALAGRGDVYVDGGIRGGGDVLRALALGARAVLVGRPLAWALAGGGEDGVRRTLEGLRQELQMAMALAGAATLAEVGRDLAAAP